MMDAENLLTYNGPPGNLGWGPPGTLGLSLGAGMGSTNTAGLIQPFSGGRREIRGLLSQELPALAAAASDGSVSMATWAGRPQGLSCQRVDLT